MGGQTGGQTGGQKTVKSCSEAGGNCIFLALKC